MTNPLYDTLLGQFSTSDAPLLYLPDGLTITYSQMAMRVQQISGMMASHDIEKGDRLALQVAKSSEALAIYLACLYSGVIFLPLNTAYTSKEIGYFIDDATPRMIIIDPTSELELRSLANTSDAVLLSLDSNGNGSFKEAVDPASPQTQPISCTTDDLACFLYTSGTTGRSKGAMLTQGNLLSNALTLSEAWRFTSGDVLLHALPIFHAHGLFVACNVVMNTGAAMIWQPSFTVEKVLDALPQATTMMGVPTFYTRLLDSPSFTHDVTGHMRLFTSGSAPLLAETHDQFRYRTGLAILERYGMTETGMNTSNPYEGDRRAGTVGFPLHDVEVIIRDQNSGKELSDNQTGMIEVRGPNVFKGYWRMPEKTADELREDGFFITGDLGQRDAEGYITIVGRQKDLIISGGYNVYPKEVELLLDDQTDVRESAVIGVPHRDFGEAVIAIIVAETGSSPDVAKIGTEMARSLANYKCPKRIEIINALPRNTMGKVQKNVLRDTYGALFE